MAPDPARRRRRSYRPRPLRRRYVYLKPRRRGGRKALGTVGAKGFLAGLIGVTGVRYILKKFLPVPGEYVDSVSMLAMGALGKGVKKLGTANLLVPGLIIGGSRFVEDLLSPGGWVTLPQISSSGASTSGGGDVYG